MGQKHIYKPLEPKYYIRRLAVLLVLAAAIAILTFAFAPDLWHHSAPDNSANFPVPPIAMPSEAHLITRQSESNLLQRTVYPYSVIAGGVEDTQELKNALGNDPVAADHYKGFDASKARVVRLSEDRTAYVSYRIGSHIYWTKNKLRLAKGETVLTDGENFARTRCGNRLSETPQGPVSSDEPTQETLDKPHDPPAPEDPGILTADLPFDLPLGPPPSTDIVADNEDSGDFFTPSLFIVPPRTGNGSGSGGGGISGGGGGTGGGGNFPHSFDPSVNPTLPQDQPVPTPEPGTLLLLAAGISSAWLLRKRRII